jgi:hypothetical protein
LAKPFFIQKHKIIKVGINVCLLNNPLGPKNLNKKNSQANKALQTDPKLTRPGQPEVLVQP